MISDPVWIEFVLRLHDTHAVSEPQTVNGILVTKDTPRHGWGRPIKKTTRETGLKPYTKRQR